MGCCVGVIFEFLSFDHGGNFSKFLDFDTLAAVLKIDLYEAHTNNALPDWILYRLPYEIHYFLTRF